MFFEVWFCKNITKNKSNQTAPHIGKAARIKIWKFQGIEDRN